MVKFKWFFNENDFANAQKSTIEDDIFGFIHIKTANEKYIVDIHKEYYNSKDCGYDLEVYHMKDGGHGLWLGSLHDIKSVTSMCDPLSKFKSRAEKILTDFIIAEEKAA